MQKITLFSSLIAIGISVTAHAQTKSWTGNLEVMGQQLPLVFHITNDNGTISTKMDSPKQGATGITVDETKIIADSIFINATSLHITYKGKMYGDYIDGHFIQGGMSLPLILKPLTIENTFIQNRPQTPQPPFDYTTEEVKFQTSNGSYQLAGTLTLPKSTPKSVVILLSGSGQQDRDETIMGHKPFAVIADHLTKNGIAVLRYDDRGIGASGGDPEKGTSLDNAYDALGALSFIESENRFTNIPVGFLGHSEGGLIAFLTAANTTNNIDFIISMAGSSVSGDTIISSQKEVLLKEANLDKDYVQFIQNMDNVTFNLIKQNKSIDIFKSDLEKDLDKIYSQASDKVKKQLGDYNDLKTNHIEAFSNEWTQYFVKTSPAPLISKYNGRILVLQGMKDIQIIAEKNLPAFKSLLKNNKKSKIITYPDGNHLLQPAITGKLDEYANIEQTIMPEVLNDITTFILNQ